MHRTRLVLGLGLLIAAAGTANANEHPMKPFFPGTDTCYARTYSAAHLKSHPKQRVRVFQIVHPFAYASTDVGADFLMAVSFQLKGRKDRFGPMSTYCKGEPDGTASCTVEGDMGRFKLSRGTGNALIVTINDLSDEGGPDLGKGGDDKVIVLHKAPMKACPRNTLDVD